ncbi:HET-domain-containing protein [Durotheca rogersii]|uniref:HET-domain-containing protein n=1 Tax=Durotheca rogersii TaxID=419775 RepID=UPI0022206C85|nr:HET-domain-containing protein [Durotheca rogersii]KAI5865872.1 HET-domain-containing protein [Durotheca rogersii]
MGNYCYVPFDMESDGKEFRTFTLLPGLKEQPLECLLEHGDIAAPPVYDAVSYVWGDPLDSTEIICNGKALTITTGLAAALRHLRSTSARKRLWADAICINQNDTDERENQVLRMKDIYKGAREVFIWLGEEREDSDKGVAVAKDLARAHLQFEECGGTLETLNFDDENVRRLFGRFRDPLEFPRLSAFATIIRRLWFTRVWVVQELALATEATAHCGDSSISWDDLVVAITVQDHLNLWLSDHERNAYVFILERARRERNIGRDLLSVLFRYRILNATDARDKIFGLSALAESENSEAGTLRPDYNVSTAELYVAVARKILKDSEDLNLLSVPRRFLGTCPSGLPSWAPDWSNTRLTAPLGLVNYSDISELAFAASGPSRPQIRLGDTDLALLGVWGHDVDRIASVGTVLMLERLPRTNYHGVRVPKCAFVLDDWSRVAELRKSELYRSGEPIRDAFIQTLVAESSHESVETLRSQLDILERYAVIARWVSFLPEFLPNWLVDKIVGLVHAAVFRGRTDRMTLNFRRHLSSLADRRVFRTERGYIGLGSALAEVGDEIVVVQGAKVPLILRARETQWTLQGDCFLKGIMQGEAYHEDKCAWMWIV